MSHSLIMRLIVQQVQQVSTDKTDINADSAARACVERARQRHTADVEGQGLQSHLLNYEPHNEGMAHSESS